MHTALYSSRICKAVILTVEENNEINNAVLKLHLQLRLYAESVLRLYAAFCRPSTDAA
jgi:hypothetical protein